jgi:hypothetical protein
MMEFVSWDDEIPSIWKIIQMFQSPPTRKMEVEPTFEQLLKKTDW